MTCGCPVLVSDRGSLPEIVGHAGRILPADDVAAWAEGMATLLLDSAVRAQMIAEGYTRARAFSWPKTAAQTLALYEQVAKK